MLISITNISISTNIVALSPLERWEAAARGLNDGNLLTKTWFILAATAVLVFSIFLLWLVSRKQNKKQQEANSKHLFQELSERRGLSERESELLIQVAEKAGIEQKTAVFTIQEAFESGSSKLLEEAVAAEKEGESTEEIRSELFGLREKLGFQKPATASTHSRKLSSRQIPAGRKVHLTRRKNRKSGEIESLVLENNDIELLVRATIPLRIVPGEKWRVRYYFGASVWEFDTTAIRSDSYNLYLNHSDNVRFINRRRFHRVPVSYPAYIAAFPFSMRFTQRRKKRAKNAKSADTGWKPPEFVPATVTELAGPGLRIEAPLEVQRGDRILVTMKLDDQKEPDQKGSNSIRIIEDIAEVKHSKALDKNYSIAVELTGLGDTDTNELIRATNQASLRAGARGQAVSSPEEAASEADEKVAVKGAENGW